MTLIQRMEEVQARIKGAALAAGRNPDEITLCAATKTQTSQTIRDAIAAGITVCGENRVQELAAHLEEDAYAGARVHFIGHLQRNKVKQAVGRVDLIESVDGEELLRLIDRQAQRLGLVQDILLEVNLGREPNKTGLLPEQVPDLAALAGTLDGVCLRGLMGMPPPSQEMGASRPFFALARQLYVDIKAKTYDNKNNITCLSLGMSRDFEDAVLEGATLVRVGTALFGPRSALP